VETPQVSESESEVRRDGRFLDDNLELVQREDVCWAVDVKIGKVWAFISRRYLDEGIKAPDGWFFLRETIENRVLNKELLEAGAIELGGKINIGDGRKAQIARLLRG
jgi:chromosome condensin MukBEF MukE localization factor